MATFGLNISGGEFGGTGGTHGVNYWYPTWSELKYYADKGVDLIRLPIRWERVQDALDGPLDLSGARSNKPNARSISSTAYRNVRSRYAGRDGTGTSLNKGHAGLDFGRFDPGSLDKLEALAYVLTALDDGPFTLDMVPCRTKAPCANGLRQHRRSRKR